jgi:hypothetical protein
MAKAFEVQKSNYDAARPFAVVATFRSFNKIMGRYADEASAKRRARVLNKRNADLDYLSERRTVVFALPEVNY